MHLSKIILSFLTISVGAVTALHRGSCTATATVTDSMMPMPRGGAGPIDAAMAAKVYTGLVSVHQALDYLSPKTIDKLYRTSLSDPISAFLQLYVGGNRIGVAIILVATVFMDGVSSLKAIGFGLLPGELANIKLLLDGQPGELGLRVLLLQYMNAAIQAYVMYVLLSGADHAGTVLKFFCAYTGLAAAQCRITPQAALKAWGFPAEGTATHAYATQLIGQSRLALTAAMYTLGVANGEAGTAVGRVALVYLASIVEFVLSGTFTSLGMDATKSYPWMVISTVVAATLLL